MKNLFNFFTSYNRYFIDTWQRSFLFWDTLRQRGDECKKHSDEGKLPLVYFEFEKVYDGASLKRSVNYVLYRLIPDICEIDYTKNPIVIIDPRAGHGPGIGAFKRDSQAGMAFKNGHPAYLIAFTSIPFPDQTLADVINGITFFLEEVARLHSSLKPVVFGNCQAGWAAAMINARRPDIMDVLIMSGAPLSYWSGLRNDKSLRFKGGTCGGAWLVSLMSDLGNGVFDGVTLVKNFEDLNLANTFWQKMYNLFSEIDTGSEKFIDFEKWWQAFFCMNAAEIEQIVRDLFIGNKLERGEFILEAGEEPIDLRLIESPTVIFCSKGDNITPPQQALFWILKKYKDTQDLIDSGKVIIYRVHEKVGHLGIFVSGDVARKEHNAFIRNLAMIKGLKPGLYEMLITDDGVSFFERREFSDLIALGDGYDDSKSFEKMRANSEANQEMYKKLVQPIIQICSNSFSAAMMKRAHPLRIKRDMLSSANPLMSIITHFVPVIKKYRQPVEEGNIYKTIEILFSETIGGALRLLTNIQGLSQESNFRRVYEY